MKVCLLSLAITICYLSNAQVTTIVEPSIELKPTNLSLTINKTTLISVNAYKVLFVQQIHQNNQLLYQQKTQPIQLQTGQQTLNNNIIQTKKGRFFDKEIERFFAQNDQLPKGTYQVCLLVKSLDENTELGRHCQQIAIEDSVFDGVNKPKKLSGSIRLEHIYSNQDYWGIATPQQYTQIEANPTMQLKNIPFGLDIFHTTWRQPYGPSPNRVSLRFDAQQFQRQLRQQLKQKLAKKAAKIQEGYALDFAKETQWANQLQQLTDSTGQLAKALLPKLEKEVTDFKEKELRYQERKLRQRLEQKQQAFQRQKQQLLLQKDSLYQSKLEDLEKTESDWLEKSQAAQIQLDRLQKRLERLAALKRKVSKVKQQARQYQLLLNKEDFIRQRYEKVKYQNDSLRQLLPQNVNLENPETLKNQLLEEGLLSTHQKWLLALQELKIGTFQPNYSSLILSGTQANGMALQIHPNNNWQFAGSIGKIQTPLWGVNASNETDFAHPTIAAGKVTWQNSSFQSYLTAAFPFGQTELTNTEILNIPTELDFLLGIGTNFSLWNNQLNTQIDAAWSKPTLLPNTSKLTDFTAININLDWEIAKQTNLTANWQSIGTNYEDIGSPLLLKGMEQVDLQLNSQLAKQNFSYGIFYLKDKNRPVPFSPFTFQNHQYGLQASWQPAKLPQINGRLSRNLLEETIANSSTWLWNLQLNYPYQIGVLKIASQLNFQQTQMQLNPQLAPQFFSYLEARQQFFWSSQFSSTFIAYHNFGQQASDYTAFNGADIQSTFQKNDWQVTFTFGFFDNKNKVAYRGNLNAQIPLFKQFYTTLQIGKMPSYTDNNFYYFGRIGLMGRL